jgi:hypothetical protein
LDLFLQSLKKTNLLISVVGDKSGNLEETENKTEE